MFRFFTSGLSTVFEERRAKQEVWRTMRRVIDLHVSQELLRDEDHRQHPRRAISIPVLVQVFGTSQECKPIIGITKNFSDDGIALLCREEMGIADLAFCAIWGTQPVCFVGLIRQSRYVGGGYWETGIAFKEIAKLFDWESLRPLAMSLNPNSR
jgi:hypothetical protein